MLNYVHSIPTKVYFGKGQIQRLPEALASFGKRVLLAYGGGSIKRIGLYDTIMALLHEGGFTVTELSGIEPNPRIESVAEGVRLCKDNDIDVILAMGGGSTIDCSKAIACGVFYEGDDLWQMIVTSGGFSKALPLVDVLTLSATGSEFDGGGVISNMKLNEKLGAGLTYPAVSICDPTYTFTVSPYQTAAGSADIMSHIFEGYFSREDDCELSDGLAFESSAADRACGLAIGLQSATQIFCQKPGLPRDKAAVELGILFLCPGRLPRQFIQTLLPDIQVSLESCDGARLIADSRKRLRRFLRPLSPIPGSLGFGVRILECLRFFVQRFDFRCESIKRRLLFFPRCTCLGLTPVGIGLFPHFP